MEVRFFVVQRGGTGAGNVGFGHIGARQAEEDNLSIVDDQYQGAVSRMQGFDCDIPVPSGAARALSWWMSCGQTEWLSLRPK